jgi:hypothetical protein
MKFHHIGFVVDNIAKYESNLLFKNKIAEVNDSIQNAKLALYNNYGDSYIELIEPLNENSFTWNVLKKNGNQFHHLCYEIENQETLKNMQKQYRLIEILKPIPAVLFNNKLVTFQFTKNKQIVEFLISESL